LGTRPSSWDIRYRVHATRRMFSRSVSEEDIICLLDNGNIIEDYEDDFPFPSVLLNGVSAKGRPLHAVIGIDVELKRLYIITVYEPDPRKWIEDYSRRISP